MNFRALAPLSHARIWAVGAAILIPVGLAAGPSELGFVTFILFWTALCISAVLAGRMLLWMMLTVGPLAFISLTYWSAYRETSSSFGTQHLLTSGFIIVSFITAGTGVLSIVRTAAESGTADAP